MEIIKLTEYELIPLCDEWWDEREDYMIFDEEIEEWKDGNKTGVWDEFNHISEELNYYNLSDSYEEIVNIVQRKSDGKYFSFISCYDVDNGKYINDPTLVEVTKRERTVIYYE